MLTSKDVKVPFDIPKSIRETYIENYLKATHNSGNLMLFAGDQKIEHLNDDFYGEGITKENATPEHMFKIASKGKIGVFATQLGLIARYGMDYPDIPYLVKLNSKSHLVKVSQADPVSTSLMNIQPLMDFKKESGLNIVGVGYTLYVGSEHEAVMMQEAARLIFTAHQYGLLTVVWAYPRGKAVPDEKDPHIIAGAAGVVACLGADFVKVNYPKKEGVASAEALKEAVQAAGRTQLICAGGTTLDAEKFLKTLHDQVTISEASGNATGRNIHQRPFEEALRMCAAIYSITVEKQSVEHALKIYKG